MASGENRIGDCGPSYSSQHRHEPEVAPVLDAEGRCLICAMAVLNAEILRLHAGWLDALTMMGHMSEEDARDYIERANV
jgi:hypothetical protein